MSITCNSFIGQSRQSGRTRNECVRLLAFSLAEKFGTPTQRWKIIQKLQRLHNIDNLNFLLNSVSLHTMWPLQERETLQRSSAIKLHYLFNSAKSQAYLPVLSYSSLSKSPRCSDCRSISVLSTSSSRESSMLHKLSC